MQRDPRADAIEQLFGGQSAARPGMKTEEDLRRFEEQNKIPRQPEYTPEAEALDRFYADSIQRQRDPRTDYTQDDVTKAYEGTDSDAQDFVDAFGHEPLIKHGRGYAKDAEYVPIPRPRYPDAEEDTMGLAQKPIDDIIDQGASLRRQDVDRMRDPGEFIDRTQQSYGGDRLSDEDLMRLIQEGLAPKDMYPKRRRSR